MRCLMRGKAKDFEKTDCITHYFLFSSSVKRIFYSRMLRTPCEYLLSDMTNLQRLFIAFIPLQSR